MFKFTSMYLVICLLLSMGFSGSLVLCLGADGHAALEIVAGDGCEANAFGCRAAEVSPERQGDRFVVGRAQASCTDIPADFLLAACMTAPSNPPPAGGPAWNLEGPARETSRSLLPVAPQTSSSSSFLSIATDVLLI